MVARGGNGSMVRMFAMGMAAMWGGGERRVETRPRQQAASVFMAQWLY